VNRVVVGETARQVETVVEVSLNLQNLSLVGNGLAELAECDLSFWHQNNRLDASGGGVCGGRSRGVSGGCTDYGFRTVTYRLRDRHGHAAVFERTGWVHALDL